LVLLTGALVEAARKRDWSRLPELPLYFSGPGRGIGNYLQVVPFQFGLHLGQHKYAEGIGPGDNFPDDVQIIGDDSDLGS
jgi:hypothetical protein